MYPSRKKTREKPGLEMVEGNYSTTQKDIRLPLVSNKWFVPKSIKQILKTRSKCNCCCCLDSGIRYDYDLEILKEEMKSTQKSLAHCKQDTNKILSKVERLEAYFQ